MSDVTKIAGFGVKGLILGLASFFVAPPLTAAIVAIKVGDQIARGVVDDRDKVLPPQPNQQNNFRLPPPVRLPSLSLNDDEEQKQ